MGIHMRAIIPTIIDDQVRRASSSLQSELFAHMVIRLGITGE